MKISKGVILNKYGALTEIELQKLFERIEYLEDEVHAIIIELGFKAIGLNNRIY